MASGRYRFEDFTLDPADRQLRRGDVPVEINARYLDALTLLIREQGRLVSKDRFLDEVWRGVPVTDEALTQCIRTLRQRLGDSVASPRFIEAASICSLAASQTRACDWTRSARCWASTASARSARP